MRDSLSKCESNLYSSIYRVERHPDFKPDDVTSPPSIPKDTLQTAKEKLHKEALERLRHTSNYTIIQHGFARIGKYLFLAVALPPYLCLYRLPKWLFLQGAPSFISWLGGTGGSTWERIKQGIEHLVAKGRILLRKSQGFFTTLIQPVNHMFLSIKNSLQRFQRALSRFRLFPITKYLNKELLASLANRWIKRAQYYLYRPFQAGFKRLENLLTLTKELSSQLSASTLSFFRKKMKPLNQWKRLKNQFVFAQKTAQHLIKWMGQTNRSMQHQATKRLEKVKISYQKLLQPKVRRVLSFIQRRFNRLHDFAHRKGSPFIQSLHQLRKKIQSIRFEHILNQIKSKSWFKKLPQFIRERLNRLIHHRFVRAIFNPVLKGLDRTMFAIAKGLEWLLLGFKALIRLLLAAGQTSKHLLSSLVLQSWRVIKPLVTPLLKLVGIILYQVLVVLVMIIILVGWGIRSLDSASKRLLPIE